MMTMRILLTFALAGFAPNLTIADEANQRLAIGGTGINCVTLPCPWRGVVLLEDDARDPLRPYWSGEHLPKLIGNDEDVAHIAAAWEAGQCIEIEGVVTPKGTPLEITVDQITGPCR